MIARARAVLAGAVAAWMALAAQAPAQSLDPATPQDGLVIRSGTDVLVLDAAVVNDDGQAVPDLEAADFTVRIDGRTRPVRTVRFVAGPSETEPGATRIASNLTEERYRPVLLAIDEGSIAAGAARAVLDAIDGVLSDLPPQDPVGLLRLPMGASVEFTRDRDVVREHVQYIVGTAPPVMSARLTLTEAFARQLDPGLWETVLTRICGPRSPARLQCELGVDNEAANLTEPVRRSANDTIRVLGRVLQQLAREPGPKALLLVSQGLYAETLRQDVQRLATLAAAARMTVYVLQLPTARGTGFDSNARASTTAIADDRLLVEGLEAFAAASGGVRLQITGSGEAVLDRVVRELRGYYLVGVERLPGDDDGEPHRLEVSLARDDLTVRGPSRFVLDAAQAQPDRAATPAAAVSAALGRRGSERGLPLRVTSFALPAERADRVRVLVSGELTLPAGAPAAATVGALLIDPRGGAAATQLVRLRADRSDGVVPTRFLMSVEVPWGEYVLRVAAVDGADRVGSVQQEISARLGASGPLRTSDLLVARVPVPGAPVEPEVFLRIEGPSLTSVVELSAPVDGAFADARVRFEVARTATGAPLLAEVGVPDTSTGLRRGVGAILDVSTLDPGMYVARAIVSSAGAPEVTAASPFEILPRALREAAEMPGAAPPAAPPAVPPAPGGRAPATPGAAAPVTAPTRAVRVPVRLPPLDMRQFVSPEVMAPFLDELEARYAPSAAARAAIAQARAARFEAVPLEGPADMSLSFVRGLRLLAEGRGPEADTRFRDALRDAPDFLGIAFYLGAGLAASGLDRDAVGAFRTALISEVGAAAVYPALVDGLLRLGDPDLALEMLDEARGVLGPAGDTAGLVRRRALAYALGGRLAEALPEAARAFALAPDAPDVLHLLLQITALRAAEASLSEADIARFREALMRYRQQGGERLAEVEGWARELGLDSP
ncbi:MAG: VWA domain-containing protein [Vicinamibacterales bacterium]